MPIDIQNFKVIYKDKLINNPIQCIYICNYYEEKNEPKITLLYLNADNTMEQIKEDDVKEFQFIRRI